MEKHEHGPQTSGPFDPALHGFVLLPGHRPTVDVSFYERRNHGCVDGKHDYRRLNLYLSQDGQFVTIWFGLLESILVEALFRDHGLEPVNYDEMLFRGYIESGEQAVHILRAVRSDDMLPQTLRVDAAHGIVCASLPDSG